MKKKLKGGIEKMRKTIAVISALALMALLVASNFALAISNDIGLESEIDSSIDTGVSTVANDDFSTGVLTESELETADVGSITDEEIEISIKSVASAEVAAENRATSFTKVSIGTGWALSDEGRFLRIMWSKGSFISNDGEEFIKSHGVLKLDKSKAFTLSIKEETENTIEFDVLSGKKTAGTLSLQKEIQIDRFTVWEGDLSLTDGKSYDVNLATREVKVKAEDKIKAKVSVEVETEGEVSITSETKEKIQSLKESMEESAAKEIKIKSEKDSDGEVSVETEVKGPLSSEQQSVLDEIESELELDLESADGKASVEIKIKSEASSGSKGESINSGKGNAWGRIKTFFGFN